MFWVHHKLRDKDYLVYGVSKLNYIYSSTFAHFLIYDKDEWEWIDSHYCEPIESTL